jgi:hypothetical protein
VRTLNVATTQKVLMLTPHRSMWGTYIIQAWKPEFVSSSPASMCTPIWITLIGVPCELLCGAHDLAASLRELLGRDRNNALATIQSFCVALNSEGGLKTHVKVTNNITGEEHLILVDYYNLPIRCRFCLATDHLIKDCWDLRPNNTEVIDEQVNSTAPSGAVPPGAEPNRSAKVTRNSPGMPETNVDVAHNGTEINNNL